MFYGVLGGWIDALLLMAGARMTAPLLLIPMVAAGIVTTAGELLLLTFGVRRLIAWLPASLVAGVTVSSIAMLPPTMILHWPAQTAFLAWSGLVAAAAAAWFKRGRDLPSPGWDGTLAILPFAVLLVGFCRIEAGAVPTLMRTNILPTWVDYFVHGTIIASFASPFAIGVGDIMLPGAPLVFYHYGPFMLPAAIAPISGLSDLAVATAILLPLGLMIGLCGLFALGAQLAGIGSALVAVWLVMILPDASHYGLMNGFYGFHWMMFTAPGSGYAIGTAALAYMCVLPWFTERRSGPLVLAGLLTLMLVMIRVHMVMLMAPALAGAVLLAILPTRWSRRVLALALVGFALLTVLLLAGLLGPGATAFTRTAEYVRLADDIGGARYGNDLLHWPAGLGILMGAALLLPAALGVWSLALPAVIWLEVRAGRFAAADWVPVLLCVSFLLLIVWAPAAGNGDLSEYKQRHFVLLYAIVAVWTMVRMVRLTGTPAWLSRWRPSRLATAVGVVTLATTFAFRTVDAARPANFIVWTSKYYAPSVEPGIPQAAAFLRGHARPGDFLAIGGAGAQDGLSGPAPELVSMTGLPIYVGRIALAVSTRAPAIAALVRQRAAEVVEVDHAANQAAAFALLRSISVRWYVMVAPDLPAWDGQGAAARFHAGSTYLYDAAAVGAPR